MQLTRHTDYALRVLLYLAGQPDRLCAIAEIATCHDISRNHLMKVVNELVRAGFVEGVRGRHGGLRLRRLPGEIRLGAVVRACEPSLQVVNCVHCVLTPGCGLTPVLGEAMAAFMAVLDGKTLADILPRHAEPGTTTRLPAALHPHMSNTENACEIGTHMNSTFDRHPPARTSEEKLALLDVSLMRAAEQLGDITDPVMARFYDRHPDALASFEKHGLGDRHKLEGQMVENTLFCLMNWLERPREIEIIFYGSVPHHEETLGVKSAWYGAMIDAAIDVIAATIEPGNAAEQALWAELRQGLSGAIRVASVY